MSFTIPSQLSENQIEADVASYLGCITPFWSDRYRLISVDEQATGADKLFDRFFPIYLQFKVSQGLNPDARILPRFLRQSLSGIISFRQQNLLAGNPILYFPLRKKAATAQDFQHNILCRLHNPPHQFGLYVAPLTLSLSEYEAALNVKWFRRWWPEDPFMLKEIEIYDPAVSRNLKIGYNPFLRHHISIPPHTTVNTEKHHYSFSQSGGDVAWHGGEVLNEDFRLSSQWLRILNDVYYRDIPGFSPERFYMFINDFVAEDAGMGSYQPYINDDDFWGTVISFARRLKVQYGIKMMILYRK
ncbi:hypothetical protein [Chitinophaga filiformis]|uniref:Uncharacterized protein n=1 Tax=Chitinophaga filiformis TaxID=104663 RepID=A0A1G7SL64_CHIFI|nr:hypothetical protein [Chitinophaga filiformis]SDG23718.1 hypothetical protein SAMN04488121_103917 [Chitinophaga filiformis]